MSKTEIKPLCESGEHSYHRRAFGHDYYAPFIYHIILKKTPECDSFGSIEGDAGIAPGNPGCARVRESDLGRVIAKTLIHFPYEFPAIKLLQFCVMPDHVHILLQVVYRSGKHLDFYIDCLCDKIAERYSSIKGRVIKAEEIFVPGYCDKPLYDNRNLDTLFRYIRENPHRLAMRKQYPQFFRRVRQLQIGEGEYEAYGNLFLLRNPDKEQVVVHRADAKMPEKLARLKEGWLYSAANGGVLVSPFISEHERDIRKEAEALGARIILITHEVFPER